MDVEYFCPLGANCEGIKDNQISRCRWYVALKGKDPQSEQYIDKWGCAIEWLPILLIENAQTNRGQTQALEMFRNEMAAGQNTFNALFTAALQNKNNRRIK